MRSTRHFATALALLVALPLAAETEPRFPPWTRGHLDIHQISTGRGNAALVIMPDGTTLLVDAGDVGGYIPLATAFPDDRRGAGEWIARYVKRMAGDSAVIDYAVLTHFHADHVGYPYASAERSQEGGYALVGIAEVAEHVPIRTLIDRGYPDYGEPAAPSGPIIDNYRQFADFAAEHRGLVRQKARVGRADQIVPVHEPGAFPDFAVRVVAADGDVWTGEGDETVHVFPALDGLPEEDRPPENICSVALRIRYGAFRFYTGGDVYGLPEPGAPVWWDVETPIARAIGRTDVMVVDHHGSIEPANPFFLATLQPSVILVPAWTPTHPSPDVLKRLLSQRIWSAPRDVFVTRLREPTKATIGPRASRVASDAGHVVVRVDPGGETYRVLVLDDTDESATVKAEFGPYAAGEAAESAELARHTVIADGHPLAVWEKSAAGATEAVLLVHGRTWSALPDFDLHAQGENLSLMDGLVDAGFAVYAVDLRGYGETPRDESGWLTPDRAADDVAIVLEWISAQRSWARKPHLFGWSMGSTISELAVQRHPGLVSSLTLFGYWRDVDEDLPADEPGLEPVRQANTAEAAASDFITPGSIRQAAIDAYVAAALAADPVKVDIRALDQYNALDESQIQVPTLVIAGEFDPLATPDRLSKLFAGLATGHKQLVLVPGGDHAALLETPRPYFLHAVVAFLQGVGLAGAH